MSASAPDIGVPVLPGRPTLLTAEYDDPLRSPKSAELLALPNARRNRGSAESGLSGPRDDPPDPPTASLARIRIGATAPPRTAPFRPSPLTTTRDGSTLPGAIFAMTGCLSVGLSRRISPTVSGCLLSQA